MNINKRLWISKSISSLYGIVLLFQIVRVYNDSINYIYNIYIALIIITIVLSFCHLRNLYVIIALLMFSLGTMNYIKVGASLHEYFLGLMSMVDFFCLMIALRFFGIIISLGRYDFHVTNFIFNKIKTGRQLFILAFLATFFFCSAIGFAGMQLIYSTLMQRTKSIFNKPEEFLVNTIKRSSSLSSLITPVFPLLPFVLSYSGIKWLYFIPYGLFISIIGFIISILFSFYYSSSSKELKISIPYNEKKEVNKKRVWQFILFILLNVLLIAIISHITHFNIINIVFLCSLIVPLIWAFSINAGSVFLREVIYLFRYNAAGLSPIFILLISTGYFSMSISSYTINNDVLSLVFENTYLALIIIPFMVISLTMLGFNALVSLTLVITSLNMVQHNINSLALTISLISGAIIATNISPFTSTTLLMSHLSGMTPFTVSIKWNGLYCLILFICIYLFNLLFV